MESKRSGGIGRVGSGGSCRFTTCPSKRGLQYARRACSRAARVNGEIRQWLDENASVGERMYSSVVRLFAVRSNSGDAMQSRKWWP